MPRPREGRAVPAVRRFIRVPSILEKGGLNDDHAGQWGTSDAPSNCTECGAEWSSGERLHTGDSNGIGGWEDWMFCRACGCEMFFPVTHRSEPPNEKGNRPA
jgi:hypothetical protein